MSSGANFFLKKALGEDFFQSLEKFELWKQGTKTVIDHEEIKTALKIVPRAVLGFLINHLSPMQLGETKEFYIPVGPQDNPVLRVTKHEKDVYSGEIENDNKKVAEFKYRSIPGVGLVIMSAFELYEVEDLPKESAHEISPDTINMVQKLIDDRLALHDLIGKVIDKKIQERDAIQQLILAKLPVVDSPPKADPLNDKVEIPKKEIEDKSEDMWASGPSYPKISHYEKVMTEGFEMGVKAAGKSPLKGFLENRKNKLKKKEYAIELTKGENVSCPDCGQNIFNGEVFSGCVCLGDDMNKKIYLTKAEKGFKVRFGKSWDPENIEMLLDVIRRKRG